MESFQLRANAARESNLYMESNSGQQQQQLRVTEDGRSLRVQTDLPHLVSLGGGRLSTAVTLLPLPQGKTRIGTSKAVDIQDIIVQGVGVQDEHCYILNEADCVTLYPIAEQTSIDGLRVTTPTRLDQGCMIRLGRSNYFRFNHPMEARRLRNKLSNCRQIPKTTNVSNVHGRLEQRCVDDTNSTVPMTTESNNGGDPVGLYDNVTNIQEIVQQQRLSRRDLYLNNVSAQVPSGDTGIVGTGSAGTTILVDNCRNLNESREIGAESAPAGDSLVRGRRRLRCGSLPSHRNPNFISTAQVLITSQPQRENEVTSVGSRVAPVNDDLTNGMQSNKDRNEAGKTDSSSSCESQQSGTGSSKAEPPWNGYDNIVELKEAMVATVAAKMAKGVTMPKANAASSIGAENGTPVVSPVKKEIKRESNGVRKGIGAERVVDVRRRLSAGKEGSVCLLSETQAGEVAGMKQDDAAKNGENHVEKCEKKFQEKVDKNDEEQINQEAGNIDSTEQSLKLPNGKKKSVSFENESEKPKENSGKNKKCKSEDCKDKPPLGKQTNDTAKKAGKNSEDKLKKEQKNGSVENKTEIGIEPKPEAVSKISFLKTLLTRTRSPSPKRSRNNSAQRDQSPAQGAPIKQTSGDDVAKRLSDPLKSSFKQTDDSEASVKVSVKQRKKEKNRAKKETGGKQNKTRPINNSNLDDSMKKLEDSSISPEANTISVQQEMSPQKDSLIPISSSLESGQHQSDIQATAATEVNAITEMSSCKADSESVENRLKQTKAEQSMKQPSIRTSPSVVASSHSEKAVKVSSAVESVVNPWLVNLKELSLKPTMDNFEGEKVFKKGTVTTTLQLPVLARSQQLESVNSRENIMKVVKPARGGRNDCLSTDCSPIYDTVYDEDCTSAELTSTVVPPPKPKRTGSIGKSCSLQDLKWTTRKKQIEGNAVSDNKTTDSCKVEHAIDDETMRSHSEEPDCNLLSLKKTVKFKDTFEEEKTLLDSEQLCLEDLNMNDEHETDTIKRKKKKVPTATLR